MQRGWYRILAATALVVLSLQAQEPQAPVREPAESPLPSTSEPRTLQEAEAQFLAGTLTARQLQRHIAAFHQAQQDREAEIDVARQQQAIEVLRASDADPAKNPPPGPALKNNQLPALTAEPVPVEGPGEEDFAEIEARMDALLREKRTREMAVSNRVQSARESPASEQTRRQRLDAILRLYIEGELSEAEYNRRRADIIAGKE